MNTSSRLTGLVSPHLKDKHILVGGVGGGSEMTVKLGRTGIGRLTIIDPDIVEYSNLARTAFTTRDLGKPKAMQLQKFLRLAAPNTVVTAHVAKVEDVLAQGFGEISKPDLIVGGTDSLAAQAFLNRLAVQSGVPAVLIDVHERAAGGMLTLMRPGITPCYRCIAARRYELNAQGDIRVNLPGAVGTGVDVGFVDHIAMKLVLAELSRGTDTDAGRLAEAIGDRTQVIVRTHPEYRFGDDGLDIFDLVLTDLPTQPKDYKAELQRAAYLCCDTLWLKPSFDPDCPDCASVRHV